VFTVLATLGLGLLMLFWVHRRSRSSGGLDLRRRRRPYGVECEVIPRRDASSDELKKLAEVLERWIVDNAAPSMTTAYALADLRQGELPRPLSVALEYYLDDSLVQRGHAPPAGPQRLERHHQVVEKLGTMGTSRAVFVRVADAEQASASLRSAIPADLVADILIDHRSWDASV